ISMSCADERPDEAMRITCVGTDPAALYLGILLKRKHPSRAVQFAAGRSDAVDPLPATLVCNPLKPQLALRDSEVQALVNAALARSEHVSVSADDHRFQTGVMRYAAIDGTTLRKGLRGLAAAIGCEFVEDDSGRLTDADIVVAADGVGSAARARSR